MFVVPVVVPQTMGQHSQITQNYNCATTPPHTAELLLGVFILVGIPFIIYCVWYYIKNKSNK